MTVLEGNWFTYSSKLANLKKVENMSKKKEATSVYWIDIIKHFAINNKYKKGRCSSRELRIYSKIPRKVHRTDMVLVNPNQSHLARVFREPLHVMSREA